ncbi:hypothetical protein WK76_24835 [Burkholderia ubonensis]|uniref:hypothetical protein n=1 Tax=Burkholderia ubonensis TaxID=101571 RepID=UPI0007542B00|nr:hypothetical protein [Burkholderia ubonensis]KVU84259.1 hypothetical protein WK76_24835 [Burkholderia ubonensis]
MKGLMGNLIVSGVLMDQQIAEMLLRIQFGTTRPYWLISSDSNVLKIRDDKMEMMLSVPLANADADRVRSMSESISRVPISMKISGDEINVYLVGRKMRSGNWAGVMSASESYLPSEATIDEGDVVRVNNVFSIGRGRRA